MFVEQLEARQTAFSHLPKQQSAPMAQDAPVWPHAPGSTQDVPLHAPRQQCEGDAHAAPVAAHWPEGSTQMPLAQLLEQHCDPAVHDAPSAASVHCCSGLGSFFLHAEHAASAARTRASELCVRMVISPPPRHLKTGADCAATPAFHVAVSVSMWSAVRLWRLCKSLRDGTYP